MGFFELLLIFFPAKYTQDRRDRYNDTEVSNRLKPLCCATGQNAAVCTILSHLCTAASVGGLRVLCSTRLTNTSPVCIVTFAILAQHFTRQCSDAFEDSQTFVLHFVTNLLLDLLVTEV